VEHVRDLARLKLNASALTVGSFDGVHRGHRALIAALVDTARADGFPAVVMTFFPHPAVVLRGRRPAFYISTPEEKAELLGDLGVDYVVTQTFSHELAEVTAEGYLERLMRHLSFRDLWIGENFALGHQRQGNLAYLTEAAPRWGFQLRVVPPVTMDGEAVSSTRVREALRAGDVARVARYLGRPFLLPGTVIRGAGRGRSLQIPTANLEVWQERACPGVGVYACLAEVAGAQYAAVTNIGTRPTFDGSDASPVVETHLLDFEGDLYGQALQLAFMARMRDEKRFAGPVELVEQIRADIVQARLILRATAEGGHG
jgi:riboflavin kinase/FMN adenylyltransferase